MVAVQRALYAHLAKHAQPRIVADLEPYLPAAP